MPTENFNAAGTSGRDCPICFRPGSLTGARMDGAPMECSGCFARFTFTQGDSLTPDTLTRVPVPPLRRLSNDELDRVRGGAADGRRDYSQGDLA